MSNTKNKGGRPRADTSPVTVRLHRDTLSALDTWIAAQPEPKPSRPEAIRQLMGKALKDDNAADT